ncbi:S-layer homology domain-containing protein [Dialister invisus]|uniref:S-layer homology domain-containing protein n=1 Tax=Dialister invisus TaxID=218538 RepID=UPI0026DD6B22|nr:S-layer homology domain-containing protein [Dialister invisus]
MNQVHKVIWSRVKNCYIVVSEITKRVGRDNKASVTGIRPLRALLCAMVIAGCMLPADADAANGLIHAGTGATASGDSSIAYGYSAEAKKEHSIAQGTKAKAEEEYALAMGYQANAKGLQSLAIGKGAIAKGNNSIAEGAGAKGYAKDGIAIGNNAESGTADNKDPRIPSIESNNGVAVGNSAKASGGSSVSVGNDSIGNGPSSVAIGNAATANDVRTTAIGNNAHAEGAGSLSIGREASALTLENATSTNPLVTGTDEQLDKKGVMAIGDDAKASGNNSIALGTSAKAGDLKQTRNSDSVTLTGSAKRITKLTSTRAVNNAVAIGTESSVQSDEDIAVGYKAATVASKYHQLPGSGQVAIGSNSNTYGSRGDVAIGSGAETNIRVKNVDHTNGPTEERDAQSVAIGSVAKAYGSQAVAVGADTRAIGNSSVAIGTDDIQLDRTKLETLLPGLANNENLNNKAPNDATLGSAALGDKPYYVKTAAIGTASVALGAMSQAAGDASMAMGLNALAEGDASTAIGPLARSKGKKSIAMGVNANSQVDGGVALGADSVSNRQQTSNAYIPSGAGAAQVNAINATKGTTGAVSVGSDTVKRQIINVAAGTNDSDAVNVAQLKAVTSNASWTAQGNGNDVNAVKNGSKVNFADGTNTTASVTKDASGKVTTVKYNLKKDVDLGPNGSLTINGNTYINKDGINAGNKQITNVASGGNVTTNAANIGDINRIVEAKDKYVTGGTADYQTNGDGTAALTGTNNLTANITGLKNNYVTSGSVSNDGKTLTLERNDTGKVNVDLSKIFTEVAKEDYHLVANPEAGSQGKYKADSSGNMVLTVANEKGEKKQVTLTDIASKAQQNTNTTNITNINNTIAKGLNFKGDDATVINKKLGEQLDIKGGADASKLTDGNIGVVSGNGALNVKLAKDVTGLNSVTAGTARMGVDSADHKSYVTGLDNRDWDVQNPVVVNGRAATEDQLKKVSDAISTTTAAKTDFRLVKNPDAADGNYSVANGKVDLKVEDKAHPTTPASTVTINNIASASDVEKLKAGFKVKAGTNEGAIKAGDTLEFAAKDNAGVEYDPAARKLTVSVSKDPTFNSVTVGDVKINNTGINAGNKQITNVASGGNVTTNAANIGDINRIVTAKDKYVTGGTADYQANGDGTAALTGTNGLTAKITGLKNNYVTSGSVSNDGKTLTLERNDTGKVNVDLSKIFTEVAKEDYHLVANPEAGSQGKYKADSSGNMVLTVANEKGEKKQVTLTDIASKAQQNTNTTNITNINKTIEKGLNFGGDSGADINKKLGEKLEIKGGASADLTDGNIGVVSDGTKLNVKLKKDVDLGPNGSLTINGKTYVNKDGLNANSQKITNVADGTANSDAVNLGQLNAAIGGTAKATTVKAKDANVTVTEGTNPAGGKEYTVGLGDKVTLGTADKKIVVDGTSGKITAGSKVTIDGTTGDIQAGTVKVTGAGTVNELTNRTWDIDNPTVVHGQAATEDQLKTVSDGVKTNKTNITNINNTIGKGLNFGGDSGAVINKKLGEKLEIKGGASADLTDDNIGVVSDGTKLNVKLKKDVNLGPDGSLTINGKTYVNKDGLNANGQKITNVANGTANSDAVNFGQLKDAVAAGKTILKDGKNTTVEGEGTVANPYKVNVNDDLVLGKKGADGKDGSIGVNGKDGSSVVIHGKDGISIKGKDGKDGVTLKAKDGANGTEGQIGLTGPAGKDGKSTHADIGVNAGPASLDPAKNLSATEMTRLYYVDEKGDHQVATMDDGMKFAGNTGLAIKKLNSTMTIRGTGTKADTEYDPSNIKTMVDADGNMIVGLDKNLKADSVGINGKDGRDGATIKGGDGKPGVDGTNITRLIIEEKNGKQHDIATLDDGMKYGGDTGAVIKKKLNEQVNVVGGITDESKLTTDDNIGVVSDGSNNLKVRLAKDVKLNSVTAGNVVMDTTGFYVKKMTRTPAGTVSLTADGLNNGGNKIANIAAGEADTDAVNVSQLKNQGSEIVNKGFGIKAEDGNEVKKKLGETVDVVGDGKNISTRVEGGRVRVGLKDDILLNSVTTGRTRMDTNGLTVQDGSGNTAVTVDKDGLKIKDGPSVTRSGIDAGGKKITNVAAGEADTDAVNVSQLKKAAAGATTKVADGKNTTVTSETNADGSKTYHVNLNDDITLGTDPSKQISIKGSEGTIKAGQVTVNGTAGTVNGLTNKTWDPNNITSGQAATEDQLKVVSGQAGKHSSVTAGSNISVTTGTNANGGTEYKVAVVDTPTFKTVTTGNTVMSNSGLTIKNGPSITQTGVDAGGKRITNVAAGKADTDAVNVGQLKQIGGAINKVDNRINRVGAGAAALAALHPLDFDPDDKWDFTLGYGNYKDAHSLALGAFYRPNEDTMISVGGSIGGGENMVNAGLSMKLGQGNHVSTSKVAMAKEIKDLRAELENVKGALLKVADGRPLDSMDMDKMQLFPDVPENHWAYDYVATLAGNGVIVGYPDGQFGGDRMMTRYEMAALIYRAMQNGAAADDRMARALKEFEPELERIRVDTISKHKDGTPDIQRVRVIKGRG